MEFLKLKISDLLPASYNPRKDLNSNDKEYKKIKRSIEEFGYVDPIIINSDNTVIGGHQRLKVLKDLGNTEIDVVRINLDKTKEKALNIALNKITGEWELSKLDELLEELKLDNYDIELTGFDLSELDNLFPVEEKETQEDDYEVEIPEEPKSKVGDVYILGNHRLMCGDSTNNQNINNLILDSTIEIIFTDPPYSSGGFQESSKHVGSIGVRGNKKIENDNLSTRGYMALMDQMIAPVRNAHTIFVFCDWKMWATNQDIVEAKGYRVRNMLVWNKIQMGMGMPFRNQHELCIFGSKISGKIGDGKTPNVLSFSRDRESKHITPKPVNLITTIINQIDGENIYDPFGGAGSTLIACEQLNRKCFMMELDPKYVDVIIDRWEKFTGKKAIKE